MVNFEIRLYKDGLFNISYIPRTRALLTFPPEKHTVSICNLRVNAA